MPINPFKKYRCPNCRNINWIENKRTGMTFCRTCGYIIGDLIGDL